MQVSWMCSLLMASPSNKVRGVIWEEGNSMGAVTIWMVTPDSFLIEVEDYQKDAPFVYDWRTCNYFDLTIRLKSSGFDLEDHNLWRIVQ